MDAPRTFALLGVGLGGGLVLGAASGAALAGVGGLILGGAAGVCPGAASWIVVIPALERKNLAAAIPVVYGPALLVAFVTGLVGPVLSVPATGLALTLGLLAAYLWCPNDPTPFPRGRCRTCGYDLAGLPGRVCPECGDTEPASGPRYDREGVVIVVVGMAIVALLCLTIASLVAML